MRIIVFLLHLQCISVNISFMRVVKILKIIKTLEKDGWFIDRQKGSHRQFKHPSKKGTVTVNGKPSDDVWGTLLSSIEEQSGLVF